MFLEIAQAEFARPALFRQDERFQGLDRVGGGSGGGKRKYVDDGSCPFAPCCWWLLRCLLFGTVRIDSRKLPL